GMAGPTTNLNTTAACAIVVFVAYHAIGFKEQGAVTYIKHFMGPVVWLAPLMMPIEIISHLARPLSLTLRLFGNMVGGHILLAVIFFLMGLNGLIGWALSGSAAGAGRRDRRLGRAVHRHRGRQRHGDRGRTVRPGTRKSGGGRRRGHGAAAGRGGAHPDRDDHRSGADRVAGHLYAGHRADPVVR